MPYRTVTVKLIGEHVLLTSKFKSYPDHGDPIVYECEGIMEMGTYVWKDRSQVGARDSGGYIKTFNGYEHGVSEQFLRKIEAKHPRTGNIPSIRTRDLQRWNEAKRPTQTAIELEPNLADDGTENRWKPKLTQKNNVRLDKTFRQIGFKYCQSHIEGRTSCLEQCDHCKLYYAPLESQNHPENES